MTSVKKKINDGDLIVPIIDDNVSPILISEFVMNNNTILRVKSPFYLNIDIDGDIMSVSYEKWDMLVFCNQCTRGKLIDEINNFINMMWMEYVDTIDELDDMSKKLADSLRSDFEIISIR